MDLCGSVQAKATICAVPVGRNQCEMPGKEKIHRLDSIKAIGNHNGCKHGISGMRSVE